MSVFDPPNQREAQNSLAKANVGPRDWEGLTADERWAVGFQLADAFVYAILDLADAIRELAPPAPEQDQ